MRILITGGAGFIGSHTADTLRNLRHNVLILDNFSTGILSNIKDHDFEPVDITDLSLLVKTFVAFKPECVLHLAANSAITISTQNPHHDLKANAGGTLNVIKACELTGVKRLVFSSTSAVYKQQDRGKLKEGSALEPNTPYGTSKLAAEMYVRFMFPNHVVLRYANIYGERQVPIGENQLIPRIIRHFQYGDNFKVFGSGKQERDFVHVSDVVRANISALISSEPGTFNISSAKAFSVNEICGIMEDVYDVKGYRWEHSGPEDKRKHACMDNTHAWSVMRWHPQVNIREGIQRTVRWWKEQEREA